VRKRNEGMVRHRGLDLAQVEIYVITAAVLRLDGVRTARGCWRQPSRDFSPNDLGVIRIVPGRYLARAKACVLAGKHPHDVGFNARRPTKGCFQLGKRPENSPVRGPRTLGPS